jgi:hypothetical protein
MPFVSDLPQGAALPPKKAPVNKPLLIGVVAVMVLGLVLSLIIGPKKQAHTWEGSYWMVVIPTGAAVPSFNDIGPNPKESGLCLISPDPGTGHHSLTMWNPFPASAIVITCDAREFRSTPVPGQDTIVGRNAGQGIVIMEITGAGKATTRYALRKASKFEMLEWGRNALGP